MRVSSIFCVIGGLTLVGCGGEKSAPPAAQRAAPPPPAQMAQRVEKKDAVAPKGAAVAKADKNAAAPVQPWPEGVPREHVFKAFTTPNANYEIGAASGQVHPDDWYVAVAPGAGSDSSDLFATPPEWAADKGRPSADAKLPEGFTAVESAGYSQEGWPRRIRCAADGAMMAFVPGGAFVQGMDGVDPNAAPAHPAEVDSFYIDVTEVTVAQYARFVEQGRATADRPPQPATNASAPADHPALGVSWGDAQAYASWARKALPTESEWELAARGPQAFVHPWGDGRAVWERHRKPGQIDPVGSFQTDRSVYGVFDMAGNAREWVEDFYHDKAYEQALSRDGSITRNWTGPKRPSPANHKVARGGGPAWQLWHRASASMRDSAPDLGFRCVLRPGRMSTTVESPATPAARPTNGL